MTSARWQFREGDDDQQGRGLVQPGPQAGAPVTGAAEQLRSAPSAPSALPTSGPPPAPAPAGGSSTDTPPASAPLPPPATDKVAERWRRASGTAKPRLIAASRPFGIALFRTLFTMDVTGLDNVPAAGPVLLAGNHTGFLDGPLVYAFSPRAAIILTKSELFVGPLGRALGWLGQVPIHRGRPDRTALRACLRVLCSGGAVGVFPEGTRGTGLLEEVNDGLAYLAVKSGAPVVPIAIIGTAEALPKGAKLPRWRAPVTVAFGVPVQLTVEGDPRARRTVRAAAEELRLALLAHVEEQAQLLDLSESAAPGVATPEE